VHVVFGSSYEFPGYESAACGLQLELSPPIRMSGEERDFLLVHVYGFAEDLAPPGKVLVKAMYPTHYARWARLRAGGRGYREAKKRAAAACIEAMERYFPGFGGSVEMTDVATPVTFHRYTENQLGSLIAWGAVPGAPMTLKRTVPGVERLVLAGHWRMPGGGVPQAALSGRHAVQWICRREGIAADWPAG
jgi:phytoene dehydrogenase-like protein